jgi:DNA-binding HxlR family transcriptional regulator
LIAFVKQANCLLMSRNRFDHLTCSLARALDQAGDWWTFLIVRDALRGVNSFDAFEASLGIATNVLAARLKQLCSDGILVKSRCDADRRRSVYALTQKGLALAPALVALMQWGDEWISGHKNEPIILRDKKTQRRIDQLELRAGSYAMSLEDIEFTLGPGADSGMRARSHK